MPVSFNTIPSNIRVPLFYAEMDNSAAGTFQQKYKALLIGQSLNNKDINIPRPAISEKSVEDFSGEGSMLTSMYKAFIKNDPNTAVWLLPLQATDNAKRAKGYIEISGKASTNSMLHLYIAGIHISLPVTTKQTADQIADTISTSINNNYHLPVTSTVEGNKIIVECKWKGASGNDIDIRLNYLGEINNEKDIDGLNITISEMSDGAINPSIEKGLANIGDEEFDYIVLPYTDNDNLNLVQEFMNDDTGRWAYSRQIYGHVFSALKADLIEAQTFGTHRNDQHCSVMPVYASPTPVWEIASILAAQSAKSLSIDPARPLQTLPMIGVLPPSVQDRFNASQRNTLLFNGLSTFTVQSGVCLIERIVTTYQKNKYGISDNSYLDVETLYTSAYVIRAMRQRITQKYGRHKLADDDARFGAGQAIVTPKVIKAEIIALYDDLEYLGLVENSKIFQQHLIVERDKNDVSRINVLFPPDYVNQLRIFSVLNQFRLNY